MPRYFGNQSNAFHEFMQGQQLAQQEAQQPIKNELLRQQMQNQGVELELNRFKAELAKDQAKQLALKQDMEMGTRALTANPTPEAYKSFYDTLTTKHGMPPALLTPPEQIQTPEQVLNYVYGPQMMQQKIKRMGEKPTISGGYLLKPGSNAPVVLPPTQQQQIQNQMRQQEIELRKQQVGQGKTTIKEMADPEDPQNRPPGLFLIKADTGDVLKRIGTSKTGAEPDFTPEGIDFIARNFLLTGQIPGLGLGRTATIARMKVIGQAAKIAADEGLAPTDVAANKAVLGSLKSELSRTMGQRGPMLAFAKTADENLKIALNLSNKVDRSGVPVLNRWINAGRRSVAGDPQIAAFDAATRVAINEFAKVTSSATGGGVTSDAARKEIEGMLNTAQTPEQFKAVYDTLKMDMENRVKGYEESVNRVKDAIQTVGKAGGGGGVSKPSTANISPQQASYNRAKAQLDAMPPGPTKDAAAGKMRERLNQLRQMGITVNE